MTIATVVCLVAASVAGDDEFQYEAFSRGAGGRAVRPLVTTKVRVEER